MATATVIRAGVLLAGRELHIERGAGVRLEGDAITEIGPPGRLVRDGDEVVDASDLAVLPGFIDSHVHIGLADAPAVASGGITSVRDLGAPVGILERRRDTDTWPRLAAVGPIVTAPGGYPSRARWAAPGTALEVTGEAAARAAVEDLAQRGAAAIKIALDPRVGPVLDAGTLGALCDQAHRKGLRVTAHIAGRAELRRAIELGVDELAHMLLGTDAIPDPWLDDMVERGMTIVPTLAISTGAELEAAIDGVARFRSRGGTVLYGTDLGNEGPRPGIDATEIARMQSAGFGSLEIVRAATVAPGDLVGLDGVGRIEPGARADLVGVPLAALEDPSTLADVRLVFLRGRRLR